ncbi:ABC-F family ATP-binding cassette domain-containing protein [Allorhodopirellula heiligendammensis]|uniref:ABC transporter ATP-binding protein YheS n=1 Tax=Allorhodopirellula heiligendammensis TaxID=2714739 RepID=A0A5C6BET1_9BACT|nr:ABC-F family ATP-binding cassette domain-containing protein [Allorhodopirellula heiligendammensis]TWU09789.1 putative ABC transporter ATP-binding protein YheS [Allorhodopirellula heiligendammensis]
MSQITLTQISWSTPDGHKLFQNFDLNVVRERIGIVGRNGVGKSTLLKLISGELQSATGRVVVAGKLGVLQQQVQIGPDETVADLFGASKAIEILRRAEVGQATIEELADADWTLEGGIAAALGRVGLQVRPETRLRELSGGQWTRACIAVVLYQAPDFLLLDEPTNNLDRAGREAVISLISNWKAGAIVSSHDRELLEQMDAIVELTSIGVFRYGGNWSQYRQEKAIELEAAQHDLAHAKRHAVKVKRDAQTALERKQRRDASGSKTQSRGDIPRILLGARKNSAESSKGNSVRRSMQQKARAEETVERALARVEIVDELSINVQPTGLSNSRIVAKFDAVSAGYDSDRPIIHDLSFSLFGPERVALVGPNGSGKTTVIRLLEGQVTPLHGTVSVSDNLAVLDQRVNFLDPSLSILDNFKRRNPTSDENLCRRTLASFLFKSDAVLQTVGTLSGGQILRAGLACVLGAPKPPSMLILDEPTNHLDIDSIEAIEQGLNAYDGALLVASHDDVFLNNIKTTRRIDLSNQR